MSEQAYVDLWDARVVDEEVIDIVWRITESLYPGAPIDWDDVWERLDGDELKDGRVFNTAVSDATPGLIAIKQEILRLRREGEKKVTSISMHDVREITRQQTTLLLEQIKKAVQEEARAYWHTSGNDVRSEALDALSRALDKIKP